MPTVTQWVQGARPRTLPNAVAPVLVGTGGAIGTGALKPGYAVLALLVAVAMVIGVNYANDYSDGARGTDENRVGPLRLVGSGLASPDAVRTMALAWLSLAALAGVLLVSLSRQWWLLAIGAICLLGAWFYTGGRHPYGYLGLGEVAVFVFFGPVAVLGTAYVQSGPPNALTLVAAVGVGMLSCSVLVANNLRDIGSDAEAGKRTLAVLLGDTYTRWLYTALLGIPFLLSLLAGLRSLPMLIGLLGAPLAISPVRRVLGGAGGGPAHGAALVAVLGDTAMVMLAWSLGTAVGLALGMLA